MTRKALGKGLSSLIPEGAGQAIGPPPPVLAPEVGATHPTEIELDRIDPNPFQPRQHFREAELEELSASILQHGVVQPVLMRPRGTRFQLVVGERRVRAAQRAGMLRIPAVVREISDDEMAELALVENVQRENLDPIEEAQGYLLIKERLQISQADVAQRVGKDRSTVANSLRLLKLSEFIQAAISDGRLSPGHGRALLSAPEKQRDRLARRILQGALSVRQAEKLTSPAAVESRATKQPRPADPNTRAAEERLAQALATRVRIRRKGEGGTLEIAFHNEEELDRLFESIVR
jgi:ParB family chromosome partitioning protein